MEPTPAGDLEGLLREQAWLRAFVQRLVARDDADDVVQQTWLAALLRPVSPRDPRAWLSALASNLARLLHRRELRRRGREREAAQQAHGPAAADAVARLELQRLVAAAVCALQEPTRSVVVLRYHDGLAVDAIAARLGMSEPAARKRLQRGRDAVRAALARDLGDEWRSLGSVLAFAGGRQAVRTARRAALLSAAALAFAGVSIGCLAASGASHAALTAASATSTSSAAHGERASRIEGTVAEVAPQHTERERLEPQGAERSKPAVPAFFGVRLFGRCVAAETKAPLAGVTVKPSYYVPPGLSRDSLPKPQQTGADGRFELTVPLPGGRVSLWLDARERVSRTDSFEATDKAPRDLGDIAMEPGHELHGRVVDERAMPTAGIRLRVRYVQGIVDNQSISLPTTTDPDGRFTVDRLPAGPVAFELNAPGLRLLTKDCTIEASATTDVVVRVASVPVISGVVFDPEGHPVDGVEVGVGGGKVEWPLEPVLGNARTRADGSFEITRPDDVGDEVQLQVGSFPRQYGRQRVGDPVRWGTHGLRLVATPNPTLELLARDESGRPVEEFSVFLSWNVGMYGEQTGDSSGQGHHPNGSALGYPMRRGTTAFTIIPSDRQLTCRAVLVDGDRIPAGPLAVRLETLHAFTAQVVDADDKPAAGVGVDVLELRGSSDLRSFENWRGKVQFSANGLMPLRHAGGTTDASGNVALAGTRACYDLLLVVRTKPPFTQPLTALPDDGQPLRITLPRR